MALILASSTTWADVTVGEHNGGNNVPFTNFGALGGTRYQQVYAASAFPGVTAFNTLSFVAHSGAGSVINETDVSISFSTTSMFVSGLNNILDNNIGADNTFFGAFHIGPIMPATLVLSGNTFTYDPSMGNLLMTVTMVNVDSTAFDFAGFFEADNTGVQTSRIFEGIGGLDNTNLVGALVTTFANVDASAPEPDSAILFSVVGGVLLLSRTIVRRRPRRL